jgi:hypothetical protein
MATDKKVPGSIRRVRIGDGSDGGSRIDAGRRNVGTSLLYLSFHNVRRGSPNTASGAAPHHFVRGAGDESSTAAICRAESAPERRERSGLRCHEAQLPCWHY